jgi:hypothetical protein
MVSFERLTREFVLGIVTTVFLPGTDGAPPAPAMFLLRVLLLIVSALPEGLSMPPPMTPALFPLKVLLLINAVLLLRIPPPKLYLDCALFPLIVLLLTDSGPSLSIPPPPAPTQ